MDPGVFVITHIRSCRNGAGYCILGIKCSVDTDFVDDDSGGDCKSLSAAFSPQAKFVCCKENPANFETDQEDILNAVILENNSAPTPSTTESTSTTTTEVASTTEQQTQTSIVTEIVTELETEYATKIEAITEVYTEIVTETIDKEGNKTNGTEDLPLVQSNEMNSDEANEIEVSEYTDLSELLLG